MLPMNLTHHARLSVRRQGGVEADYLPIHALIDSTRPCHQIT